MTQAVPTVNTSPKTLLWTREDKSPSSNGVTLKNGGRTLDEAIVVEAKDDDDDKESTDMIQQESRVTQTQIRSSQKSAQTQAAALAADDSSVTCHFNKFGWCGMEAASGISLRDLSVGTTFGESGQFWAILACSDLQSRCRVDFAV